MFISKIAFTLPSPAFTLPSPIYYTPITRYVCLRTMIIVGCSLMLVILLYDQKQVKVGKR